MEVCLFKPRYKKMVIVTFHYLFFFVDIFVMQF